SSKPSMAASGRPICSSRRQVMTSALAVEGARSTVAAAQRSAASVSLARRSARARSMGESVVWAPGRSGGATRITGVQRILSLAVRLFLPRLGALHVLAHRICRRGHEGKNTRVVHAGGADDANGAGRLPGGIGRADDGQLAPEVPRLLADHHVAALDLDRQVEE